MYNPNISVFKDLFKSADVPFIVPLKKIADRIRAGKSKYLIQEIRKGNKELKKKLPSIVFAGEFKQRNSKGLTNHSGLMVVDFDKYPDQESLNKHLKKLKHNKHFILLFISPSGNGIKGVVRIPTELDKDSHPKVFKAFQKHFNYDYFDISNSNVDRVCFESYDPNIYTNYNAEIFAPEIIEDGFSNLERVPVMPITNEMEIMSKIEGWNWKKDFQEGERNSYIFDLAGAFCEYGVSETSAIGYITTNIIDGDFSEREAQMAIKSAYRTRKANTKYFEDWKRIERVQMDMKNDRSEVIKKHGITESQYEEIKEEITAEDFWYFDKQGVKIDELKYKMFLESNGFKKHYPNGAESPVFVRVQSNKVTPSSPAKIKDYVLKYLQEEGEAQVWKRCARYQNLFSENFLSMLDSIELKMLNDTRETSFIAFQNCILEITKDQVEMIDYMDVDGYIWEDQILEREFKYLDNHDNNYQRFIENISGGNSLPLECVIGYLLSTYKNKMNNKAIILNDEVISENPEGGTGKGLMIQGLRQIRSVSILDGKQHDDQKSFPYQTVSESTNILVFDDVKKNFNFEAKFSLVTEGMTLERKNKDALKLPVEDSPKVVISTNYAIKGEGASHNRRRHEIEIAQYYNGEITPYDEFGEQLFDDWSEKQFNKFDNYMVHCVQMYLKNGLVHQNAKNLKLRKFIAETSMEFYEWISDKENVKYNELLDKQIYYNSFVEEYKDFNRWLTRKRFSIWVQKYCRFIGADYKSGHSNGMKWFLIKKEENLTEIIKDVPF